MTMTRRGLLAASVAASIATIGRARADGIQPVGTLRKTNSPYSRFGAAGDSGSSGAIAQIRLPSCQALAYFPDNGTVLAPIVMSHAEFASPDVYEPLLRHWVSHGFPVIAPIHEDSLTKTSLSDIQRLSNDEASQLADNRGRQLREALDALPGLGRRTGLDLTSHRPLLAGHGLGAAAAQLLLGMEFSTSSRHPSVQDDRPLGAILMSPPGPGMWNLTPDSWNAVTAPLLVVTGGGDVDVNGQTADAREAPFALSPPGHKHLALFQHITGAAYGGQAELLTPRGMVDFQDWRSVSTAFLEAYATLDDTTLDVLTSNYYANATNGRVTTSYR